MRIEPPATSPMTLRLASAYGVRPAAPASPQAPVEPVARIDRREPGPAPADVQRLVGAVVPGRVEFTDAGPRPSDSSAIAMYRRPADRNAAATAVSAGRMLDIRG
ncbi:MAG: hypothetical protein IBJ11_10280 [Phycisphaerales bacterium]|nr:hypothetical protein [Phycisphaerales bacterium]